MSKILATTNCGLLITEGITTVLIDGICAETDCFSGLNVEDFHKMMIREKPYEKIDLLIFTHTHKDHFDYKRVNQFFEQNNPSALFLDMKRDKDDLGLIEGARKSGVRLLVDDLYPFKQLEWTIGEIKLTCYPNQHSGEEFKDINHYAFLIETKDEKVYISGDSNFIDDSQIKNLDFTNVDIAFYNPYHLNHIGGRRIISAINAKQNYVYHIPAMDVDFFSISKQSIRDLGKYKSTLPDISLLLEKNKYIV